MKWLRRRSLARRMTGAFLLCFFLILLAGMMLVRHALLAVDEDNHVGPDIAAYLAAEAIGRDARGVAVLVPTEALRRFVAKNPRSWIIAELDGRRLAFGPVPDRARAMLEALPPTLSEAALRLPGAARPLADLGVTSVPTPAGRARIAVGGVDPASVGWGDWLAYTGRSGVLWVVPMLAALGVVAMAFAVPFTLRVLRPFAAQAEAVGPDRLDRRLSEDGVVAELRPVVQGFNRALDRLADSLTRQRRFLADTAHELRTPVAILGAQVDLLPDSPSKLDLQRGIARLGGLVGQMLDAERLALADRRRERVDLVALARDVVADIAPLAMAAGYDPALEAEAVSVPADVDALAYSRALANLVGNAIAHGGRSGQITVRVRADGAIDVADEGPGVPEEARARIFEPFRRERWDRDGCGLGLHLVRTVMRAHGGDVRLLPRERGATFRLELPGHALRVAPRALA